MPRTMKRQHPTKFLVIVDDTPECRTALRFASLRAKKTGGRVIMLRVIEPVDNQHWAAVGRLMREEQRQEAEKLLQGLAAEAQGYAGLLPEYAIREGRRLGEILALIDQDPDIRVLMLGASPAKEGPGPLVSKLAGQMSGSMPVPITLVPGNLSLDEIEEMT
ncbi:MAG: universal stress protein [Alphaproteobacteria bacterium]|nr:universal stress protein [Alphaproteobacteria bacterium]